jgi:hypothetical protein
MTREEALKKMQAVKAYMTSGNPIWGVTEMGEAFDMAIKALEEPQWVPCSNGQMPDDLAEVNITWVNRDPEPYYAFLKDKPFTGSAVYYKGKWYWYSCTCVDILSEYGENHSDALDNAIDVIAWKPLPEPWRGDTE